jgi:hypothetical protein
LNAAMFSLYGDSGAIFGKNILAQHPVILALFSGAGGCFIHGWPPCRCTRSKHHPFWRLSAPEVHWSQYDGDSGGGGTAHRQACEPILACADARLSRDGGHAEAHRGIRPVPPAPGARTAASSCKRISRSSMRVWPKASCLLRP